MSTKKSLEQVSRLIRECKKLNVDKLAQGTQVSTHRKKDLAIILEVCKIIKKTEKLEKRSELLDMKQTSRKSKKQYKKFCESLTKDFVGAMRLYGKLNDQVYTVGLLLENGDIIAASFEDRTAGKVFFGERVMSQIVERLPGTKGDLEVYALNEGDMEKAKGENEGAFLSKKIPFSSIGMTVKSKVETLVRETCIETFSRVKITKLEELTSETFNLVDFARKFQEIETDENQSSDEEIPIDGEADTVNISEIKNVETTIDELYRLAKENNVVRINDQLASSLEVKRSKLERWAEILEKNELVTLNYPTFGEPEIKVTGGLGRKKPSVLWVDGFVSQFD